MNARQKTKEPAASEQVRTAATVPMADASGVILDQLMKTAQAAAYLGTTEQQLEQMRTKGDGPDFIKISHRVVRYRKSDLDSWIESRVRRSTQDSVGKKVAKSGAAKR